METPSPKTEKTLAALIHLSTFSQIFFPFGNFLFPLILWTARRDDPFIDEHGKQALNFQISLYLYVVFLILAGISGALLIGIQITPNDSFYFHQEFLEISDPSRLTPLVIFILTIILLLFTLCVLGIYSVVMATIKAGEGEYYRYPLSIKFLRTRAYPTEKTEKKDSPPDETTDRGEF